MDPTVWVRWFQLLIIVNAKRLLLRSLLSVFESEKAEPERSVSECWRREARRRRRRGSSAEGAEFQCSYGVWESAVSFPSGSGRSPALNDIWRTNFVANFISFSAVQKFWKSVKIWQSHREFKGVNFFWDTAYICIERSVWFLVEQQPVVISLLSPRWVHKVIVFVTTTGCIAVPVYAGFVSSSWTCCSSLLRSPETTASTRRSPSTQTRLSRSTWTFKDFLLPSRRTTSNGASSRI